jgi:hypothetical protein
MQTKNFFFSVIIVSGQPKMQTINTLDTSLNDPLKKTWASETQNP